VLESILDDIVHISCGKEREKRPLRIIE